MSATCYIAWNAATGALTGPPTAVATSATSGTVKTMLQIAPNSNQKIRIVEWGYLFDSLPSAPVRMELVETDVAATVTAHVAAGVTKYNDASGPGSQVTLSTTATGYTSSNENTITASRLLAYQYDTAIFFKQQFPLGREPEVNASKFLRLRATPSSNSAVNVTAYIIWEE